MDFDSTFNPIYVLCSSTCNLNNWRFKITIILNYLDHSRRLEPYCYHVTLTNSKFEILSSSSEQFWHWLYSFNSFQGFALRDLQNNKLVLQLFESNRTWFSFYLKFWTGVIHIINLMLLVGDYLFRLWLFIRNSYYIWNDWYSSLYLWTIKNHLHSCRSAKPKFGTRSKTCGIVILNNACMSGKPLWSITCI